MPNRLISSLSIACGAMIALYLVLVVMTIFFASWQTELARSVRETEGKISTLEAKYYVTISALHNANPAAAGFVQPHTVAYVASAARPALSLGR